MRTVVWLQEALEACRGKTNAVVASIHLDN